jgi:hypothetical protein
MADRARVYEVGPENALSEDLLRQEKLQSKRLERRRFWNFKRLSNLTIAVCVFISLVGPCAVFSEYSRPVVTVCCNYRIYLQQL